MNPYKAVVILSKAANINPTQLELQCGITDFDMVFEPKTAIRKLADFYKIEENVMIFLATETKDIPEHKRELFKALHPTFSDFISETLNNLNK